MNIEELREPIRDLLRQLHEHINNGSYKLLIGGDASGRIPALIFDKVIRKIYREKGFDVPRTLTSFIAGGQRYADPGPGEKTKSEEIKTNIRKHYIGDNLKDSNKDGKYDGRVLIVEDTIASGASIQPVTQALRELGIEFDIATIGFMATNKKYIEDSLGGTIFHYMDKTPNIYARRSLSGVAKNRGDLFSLPQVSRNSIKARVDTDKVADELADWYLANF